jgi:hypothetical protein
LMGTISADQVFVSNVESTRLRSPMPLSRSSL